MPDIKTVLTPEQRKEAERIYSVEAFDFVSNPIGSRDWCLFWHGYQAALAASDERKDATPVLEPVGRVFVDQLNGKREAVLNKAGANLPDMCKLYARMRDVAAGKAGEVKS